MIKSLDWVGKMLKEKRETSIFFFLYFLSFCLMLFNTGIYWDDWTLFNQNADVRFIQFQENGGVLYGYLHNLMHCLPFTYLMYRYLTFTSFFISALLLGKVLRNITRLDSLSVNSIIIIFALFPVNEARITAICFPYSLSLMFFLMGFLLVVRSIDDNNFVFRLVGQIFLFLAFFVSSFLLLYPFLLACLYSVCFKTNLSVKNIVIFVKKHIDFILLPFLFWFVRNIFFHPTGVYKNYNVISLDQIIHSPLHFLYAFKSSFFDVIVNAVRTTNLWIGLSLFIITFALLFKIMTKKEDNKQLLLMIFVGLVLCFFAIFPYIAVGRSGFNFGSGWNSRDQLLIPLGASFFLFGLLRMLVCRIDTLFKILLSTIIVCFTCFNALKYYTFLRDDLVQQSFIVNISESQIIKNNTAFVFIDNTYDLKAFHRKYAFMK